MNVEMDRTRLAIIIGAVVVLMASIVGFLAVGGDDSPTTTSGEAGATATTGAEGETSADGDIQLPVVDPVTGDTVTVTSGGSGSVATTRGTTQSSGSAAGSATTVTSSGTPTTITFSSSPPVTEGERRGCPDGLILVGSNGTEPICQQAGAGCPDTYAVIGGVDGALLCKGPDGDVLRVQPDGTVTIDNAIGLDGPVCQRTDSQGRVIELTLAVDEADCVERGGEFFPDGIG